MDEFLIEDGEMVSFEESNELDEDALRAEKRKTCPGCKKKRKLPDPYMDKDEDVI